MATCQWCGNIHGAKCPIVKAFEFHPDGTVKRVEFYAPNDYAPISYGRIDTTPLFKGTGDDPNRFKTTC